MNTRQSHGFSLIGMMITLACILVITVLLMNSMNKAVTGNGQTARGTVNSVLDQMNLRQIYNSMYAAARDFDSQLPTPAGAAGGDESLNTTANFYSLLIAQHRIAPTMLISENDRGIVEPDQDYNYLIVNSALGQYWDPSFKADLLNGSNVSYAHMPFYGDRFEDRWNNSMSRAFPLFGYRGPKNGVPDIYSNTCDASGQWAGSVVFADGTIEFLNTMTPGKVAYNDGGQLVADNLFAIEDGIDGSDAILSFTSAMESDGPVLQWD